ncbi:MULTISPECIES: hypothetical protein, partial [Clostridia]|uniref:hypothetical protein n=1 Tax=Clostridia TaxID=186801 RepID=UPI0019D591E9
SSTIKICFISSLPLLFADSITGKCPRNVTTDKKFYFLHFSVIAVQNNNSIIGSYQRFINAATIPLPKTLKTTGKQCNLT